MKERGVASADVAEALATPRLRGGIHAGERTTVVIGTQRGGGQVVKTVWPS
jgi:hypothetical protein